jgi:hypothetical protein
MPSSHRIPGSSFGRDAMPLDAARAAFDWLLTGADPVSIDGRLFPGLPARQVPLGEVRDRLLHRRCPQELRDAVWAHLVLRSRTEGGTWTVGCVGVALPALTTVAARLSARFAGDRADIHAAVLTGFLTELARANLRKPRIMLRLRWAAYRAGHAYVREALDAPVPAGIGFTSAAPRPPWGHPDFVLARAVAESVITASEAELIGATRLEGVALAEMAAARSLSYDVVQKIRRRAEYRLRTYLTNQAATDPPLGFGRDIADDIADSLTITDAAHHHATHRKRSPSVTELAAHAAKKTRRRLSENGAETGVQRCGKRPATPATTTPPTSVSGPTPEVPRCA